MSSRMAQSQFDYLMRGGPLAPALQIMREKGLLPETYEFIEFPKALNLPLDWIGGQGEVVANCIVADEQEEAATRIAFDRAREFGVRLEPDWDAKRIRDAVAVANKRHAPKLTPEQVKAARVAALKAELAALEPAEAAAAPVSTPKRRAAADLPVVAPFPDLGA
jgi:hypothetical protein